jgi:HSP20 family protein
MALVRYEPWNLVSQLQGEINRAVRDWSGAGETSSATADWVPAVDVDEYEDRFELFVDVPGVAANDVEITLDSGVLSLSGERKVEHATGQLTRHRRERGYGKFYRRFILPDTVNADEVKASERNGVLAITIPKKAAAQPRKIEIAA